MGGGDFILEVGFAAKQVRSTLKTDTRDECTNKKIGTIKFTVQRNKVPPGSRMVIGVRQKRGDCSNEGTL